jgi:hypothetical protein
MSEYKNNNSYDKLNKNIIIYAHRTFFLSDGGIVVQYYLASVLDSMGIDIKICNVHDNNAENELFNKFITIDEINKNVNFENTIVIYCEGIVGNPLNAKYVVRWLLSKLGQNVPIDFISTWGENELVYFFNSENDIIDNNYNVNYLTLTYINPIFEDKHFNRKGKCFTKRKNNSYIEIDKNEYFEVTRVHSQNDYLNIFNQYEKFISYDPMTFLSIIALKCGCVSVVYPIENISKKDYFKMTAFYDYMVNNNVDSIYGIAYGNSDDELMYSKNTLCLFEEQFIDINNWFIENYVKKFVNDIINWNDNNNTIFNYKIFLKQILMKNSLFDNNFDIDFYRNFYGDLQKFDDIFLLEHYVKWGNREGRVTSQKQLDELIASTNQPDFDVNFYKYYYKDLTHNKDSTHMHICKLIEHYNEVGKLEGRVTSKIHLEKNNNNYSEDIECIQLDIFKLLTQIEIINSEPNMKIDQRMSQLYHWDKITCSKTNALYLSWFKDSIINKKISITSPITNKVIYSDKYFITNNDSYEKSLFSVCNYYFDTEGLILGLGLGTGNHPQETHVLYLYSIKGKKVFYGWLNYSFEKFKNNLLKKIMNIYTNKIKNYNFDIIDSKIITTYGFMSNMGHGLFNDYTGLFLIDYHNLIQNVDEVFFGPYDIYYVKKYFQQFKQITIKEMNTISDIEIIGKGIFFKYNHHYILNDTISFLKKNLIDTFSKNIQQKQNYKYYTTSAELIKKTYYPIFNIVLRKGDFEMNNQVSVISNLINLLIKKYPNCFFYLDGFVKNTRDDINIGINHNLSISDTSSSYLKLSNEIINNINTNNYLSLINTNILNLITHLQNCNYGIYTLGSAACISAWICKIPGIQFGRPNIKIYEHMDKLIREDNPSIIYLEDKITYNADGTFDISEQTIFDLIPEF